MYILVITVIIKSPHGDLSIVLDEHRARTAYGMKGISTSLVAKAPAQKWEDPDLFTSLLRAHTPPPPRPSSCKTLCHIYKYLFKLSPSKQASLQVGCLKFGGLGNLVKAHTGSYDLNSLWYQRNRSQATSISYCVTKYLNCISKMRLSTSNLEKKKA